MTPVRIEERPDVVVDGRPGLGLRRPGTSVDELRLQGREDTSDFDIPSSPSAFSRSSTLRVDTPCT